MKSDNGLIQADTIREHYNQISSAYGLWWGEHMHHGFWDDGESLAEAQVKLIERLAAHAQVPHFARVLDVGCGLGGASLWLARNLDCSVLGITNSPEQAKIARRRAHAAGFDYELRFAVMDANQLDLPRASFDVVWVLECSEHLAERAAFIRNCARVLKPGGVLALSAWLASSDSATPEHARLLTDVCQGFLCPPLATMQDYVGWMEASDFDRVEAEDLTPQVTATWRYFSDYADRWMTKVFLRLSNECTRRCVEAFSAVRRAYAEGALAYGMFTAVKQAPQWRLPEKIEVHARELAAVF